MREQTPVDRLSRAYRKEFGPWEWREDNKQSVGPLVGILFGAAIVGIVGGFVLSILASML